MSWPENVSDVQATFAEHGFAVLEGFCSPSETRDLVANLTRYIDQVVPTAPPMDAFFEDSTKREGLRMLSRMEKHDAYFRNHLRSGRFQDLAESMIGRAVSPHDLAYFNKLPTIGDATPPHQDGYYFKLTPCEAVTLWLALDDVDEDNGCIRYVSGSHRRGMRCHGRTNVLGFSQGISDYGNAEDVAAETPVCVSAGDLIVHHALTIHRADPNLSSRTRRALGFVYFAADAKVDHDASGKYQKELANDWKAEGRI
jgi:phytanoyl-CoA hydroxylase